MLQRTCELLTRTLCSGFYHFTLRNLFGNLVAAPKKQRKPGRTHLERQLCRTEHERCRTQRMPCLVFAVENHDASERQLCRTQHQRCLKHQQQPPNVRYLAKRPRMKMPRQVVFVFFGTDPPVAGIGSTPHLRTKRGHRKWWSATDGNDVMQSP